VRSYEEFGVEGNGENHIGKREIGGESKESGGRRRDPGAARRTVTEAMRERMEIGGGR
jgi:hypothetical protein